MWVFPRRSRVLRNCDPNCTNYNSIARSEQSYSKTVHLGSTSWYILYRETGGGWWDPKS